MANNASVLNARDLNIRFCWGSLVNMSYVKHSCLQSLFYFLNPDYQSSLAASSEYLSYSFKNTS